MITIKTGTKEEIQSRKKAERLLREKEKVSGNKEYYCKLSFMTDNSVAGEISYIFTHPNELNQRIF